MVQVSVYGSHKISSKTFEYPDGYQSYYVPKMCVIHSFQKENHNYKKTKGRKSQALFFSEKKNNK
jgi:hypothetical protein